MNYALLAENEYLLKKKLKSIVNKIEKENSSEVIEINGNDKEFNISSLLNELNTYPFLWEHRIVIVNNPVFLSAKGSLEDYDSDALEAYLKSPADFSTLILVVDQYKVDNRKKITKLIKKHTEVYEPDDMDDRTISNIIEKDLKAANVELAYQAKIELEKRMIPNFNNWPQELEKIKLYNKFYLEKEDVELLITSSDADNIFELVNGVLDKNLYQSLTIYRELPNAEREPIALIMLLASQFRLIHQVQTLAYHGMDNPSIASQLKVHPYRVKIARGLSNRFQSIEVLKILNKLAELEQNIKYGLINPDIGFELFLIEVSQS